MSVFRRLAATAVDLIFPPLCVVCETVVADLRKTYNLCAACEENIKLGDALECAICGARLPDGKKICHPESPYLLAAAAKYENETVQRLIWQLKYRGQTVAARPLAHLMSRYWKEVANQTKNPLVIPLPLHRRRLKIRGFNQAELLARRFAQKTGLPINSSTLRRVRYIKPQAECVSRAERVLNIQHSFLIKKPEQVRGKNIILVDDVTTSGATLREAALTIKRAGGKNIIALVAARA